MLIKSPMKKAVGKNIKTEMATKPQKQAVAIALNVQRKAGGGNALRQFGGKNPGGY